jgi:hypothetical protein
MWAHPRAPPPLKTIVTSVPVKLRAAGSKFYFTQEIVQKTIGSQSLIKKENFYFSLAHKLNLNNHSFFFYVTFCTYFKFSNCKFQFLAHTSF